MDRSSTGQDPGADAAESGDAAPQEVRIVASAALERNARHPVLLDLRGISDAADYFIIASGDSDTHTRAIAENIIDRMREAGIRPTGVEGQGTATWILIDYINVVVHVFVPRIREFYQLEILWGDAPASVLH